MSGATKRQIPPKGYGRDITELAINDIQTRGFEVPERNFETVETWIRSIAIYLKTREFVDRGLNPSSIDVALALAKDLDARTAMGEKKYGERLKAHNGRIALLDLYQEILDSWMYSRQVEEEEANPL